MSEAIENLEAGDGDPPKGWRLPISGRNIALGGSNP